MFKFEGFGLIECHNFWFSYANAHFMPVIKKTTFGQFSEKPVKTIFRLLINWDNRMNDADRGINNTHGGAGL